MAKDPLRRYYDILHGDEQAAYLRTKEMRVEADLSGPMHGLLDAHRKAMDGRGGTGLTSVLDLKIELARRLRSECAICERRCMARRDEGETGHCGVLDARIASEFIHMGEEPDLVPSYTVFFAGCTFDCIYCQNWDISTDPGSGTVIAPEEMAEMIRRRAATSTGRGGARNVNWVGGDPSSNLLYILQTLKACDVDIPQVWNSNMYLTEEAMEVLGGVVDVYLTDFKYGNDECGLRLSNAPEYMRVTTRNHLIANKGAEMIIRHLVLPGHIECCTRPVLSWISKNLTDVKVNVMGQYRPAHLARNHAGLSRALRLSEYEEALRIAERLGLQLTG